MSAVERKEMGGKAGFGVGEVQLRRFCQGRQRGRCFRLWEDEDEKEEGLAVRTQGSCAKK